MNKASLGGHPEFVMHAISNDPNTTTAEEVEEKLAATYFITFADPGRFSGLWEDLHNATLLGRDEYPLTLTMAYDLLNHYRSSRKPNNRTQDAHVSFAQMQSAGPRELVPGTDGNTHDDVTCFKCMRGGHIVRHCPARNKAGGVQNVQVMFTHSDSAIVPKSWI